MESYDDSVIPMGPFAHKDPTVRSVDLWLQEGESLRKQMKMLTKRTPWNFKESQCDFKIQIHEAKAVKVLATFSNVCCAYLNFNLKIKAMHDKYWSEIIFI